MLWRHARATILSRGCGNAIGIARGSGQWKRSKELQELLKGSRVKRVKGNEMKEFVELVMFSVFLVIFFAPAFFLVAVLWEWWKNRK